MKVVLVVLQDVEDLVVVVSVVVWAWAWEVADLVVQEVAKSTCQTFVIPQALC